jgi:hypothetical protein
MLVLEEVKHLPPCTLITPHSKVSDVLSRMAKASLASDNALLSIMRKSA